MDSIGIAESDYVEFRTYYDSLVTQGIAEELVQEIVYMPTTPTEQKFVEIIQVVAHFTRRCTYLLRTPIICFCKFASTTKFSSRVCNLL